MQEHLSHELCRLYKESFATESMRAAIQHNLSMQLRVRSAIESVLEAEQQELLFL